MAQQRHLNNAPVTEALIDFRVAPPSHKLDETAKRRLEERLAGTYVLKGPIRLSQFLLGVAPTGEGSSITTTEELGARYHSSDDKFVAQFQSQGFTVSRLVPYTTWEHLRDEARRLWEFYVEALKPERVIRVACRYINNLRLPMQGGRHFEDFLTAAPAVPEKLPQAMLGFLKRVVIADYNEKAITILTQVLEHTQGISIEAVPVILDIDVQSQETFAPTDAALWECLDRLRRLKNAAFFESIHEATAELYA
jgi:uncharacterized protein (TIGR04255 family)